jgi:hypothetical protein
MFLLNALVSILFNFSLKKLGPFFFKLLKKKLQQRGRKTPCSKKKRQLNLEQRDDAQRKQVGEKEHKRNNTMHQ